MNTLPAESVEPPTRVRDGAGVGKPSRLEPRVHVGAVRGHRRAVLGERELGEPDAAEHHRDTEQREPIAPSSAPEQNEEQDRQRDQGLDVDDRQQTDQHSGERERLPSRARAMTPRRARAGAPRPPRRNRRAACVAAATTPSAACTTACSAAAACHRRTAARRRHAAARRSCREGRAASTPTIDTPVPG